nr:CAAX protease self-immunity [uncultured bacterium]
MTVAWSWFFFGVAYLCGVSGESGGFLGPILILLALAGPLVIAVPTLHLTGSPEEKRRYWRQVFDPRLIPGRWWAVILLLVPAITVVSGVISGHWQTYLFATLLSSVGITLLVSPVVPVLEELGWRGYVLDKLQNRHSPVVASIILGTIWGIWHLPAFFLQGSVLGENTNGSLPFWLFFWNFLPMTVLLTWIRNNTNGSTLSAILVHIGLEVQTNLGLWPWFSNQIIVNSIILLIVAVFVAFYTRGDLGWKKRRHMLHHEATQIAAGFRNARQSGSG